MGTTLVLCECRSDYQDARYGNGKRLANLGMGGKTVKPAATCTVCGKKHEKGDKK